MTLDNPPVAREAEDKGSPKQRPAFFETGYPAGETPRSVESEVNRLRQLGFPDVAIRFCPDLPNQANQLSGPTALTRGSKPDLPSFPYRGSDPAAIQSFNELGRRNSLEFPDLLPNDPTFVVASRGSEVVAGPGRYVLAEPGATVRGLAGSFVQAQPGAKVTAECGAAISALPGAQAEIKNGALPSGPGEFFARIIRGQEQIQNESVFAAPGSDISAKYATVKAGAGAHIRATDSEITISGNGVLQRAWQLPANGNTQIEASHSQINANQATVVADSNSSVRASDSSIVARGGTRVRAEFSKIVAESGAIVTARDSDVIARESAFVEAQTGTNVIAESGSSVTARGGSRTQALAGSTVDALAYSQVEAQAGARVSARVDSTVTAQTGSTVVAEPDSHVILAGDAQVSVVRNYEHLNTLAVRNPHWFTAPEIRVGQGLFRRAPERRESAYAGYIANDIASQFLGHPLESKYQGSNRTLFDLVADRGSHVIAPRGSFVKAEPGSHVLAENGSYVLAAQGAHVQAQFNATVAGYDPRPKREGLFHYLFNSTDTARLEADWKRRTVLQPPT